jgi:hypothetical protein
MAMKTTRLMSGLCLVAALAACGGDDAPAPATTAPAPQPPVAAQINGSNYLDAFAVGSLGGVRLLLIADAIDTAFNAVIAANDVPGTYPCAAGGSVTLAKAGAARTLTVNNCNDGVMLYVSGVLASPNAVAASFGAQTLLLSGDFTLTAIVYRMPGDTISETINGSFGMQRRSDLSIAASGAFTAARNGRADSYTNVRADSTKPDANGVVDAALMSYAVSSPRFAAPLSITGDETTLVVAAPDTSNVTAKDASSGTTLALTFEVRATSGGAASVTQTLTATDPLLVAAMTRALQ